MAAASPATTATTQNVDWNKYGCTPRKYTIIQNDLPIDAHALLPRGKFWDWADVEGKGRQRIYYVIHIGSGKKIAAEIKKEPDLPETTYDLVSLDPIDRTPINAPAGIILGRIQIKKKQEGNRTQLEVERVDNFTDCINANLPWKFTSEYTRSLPIEQVQAFLRSPKRECKHVGKVLLAFAFEEALKQKLSGLIIYAVRDASVAYFQCGFAFKYGNREVPDKSLDMAIEERKPNLKKFQEDSSENESFEGPKQEDLPKIPLSQWVTKLIQQAKEQQKEIPDLGGHLMFLPKNVGRQWATDLELSWV